MYPTGSCKLLLGLGVLLCFSLSSHYVPGIGLIYCGEKRNKKELSVQKQRFQGYYNIVLFFS